MSVEICLISQFNGEIRRFLDLFYDKTMCVEDDISEWIYVYHKALDAIDMISVLHDNISDFKIALWTKIDDGAVWKVTENNVNDIIKCILQIYYREDVQAI